MVCKIFFCVEFPNIPEKLREEEAEEEHGLQAFTFYAVTVNDEHTKPRFKGKLKGAICAENCV